MVSVVLAGGLEKMDFYRIYSVRQVFVKQRTTNAPQLAAVVRCALA